MAHDRAALERFRREAEATSPLNHPNICTICDIGEENSQAYITKRGHAKILDLASPN